MTTILIVEDSPEIANIIKLAFNKADVEFEHYDHAHDALDYLETDIPHLIILDIGMPDMNGWEFLDVIRSHSATQNIPVIVLTAYTNSSNLQMSKERDVAAFLHKPINLGELRKTVKGILNL